MCISYPWLSEMEGEGSGQGPSASAAGEHGGGAGGPPHGAWDNLLETIRNVVREELAANRTTPTTVAPGPSITGTTDSASQGE